jgi:hypothetical protein
MPLDNLGVPKISKISDQKNHVLDGAVRSQVVEKNSPLSLIDKAPVRPPSVNLLADSNTRPFWSIMIPAYNPKPEYLNKVLRSVLTALSKGVDAQIEILDDAFIQTALARFEQMRSDFKEAYSRHEQRDLN